MTAIPTKQDKASSRHNIYVETASKIGMIKMK